MSLIPLNKTLILYDGICNLCNATIQRIIKYDKANIFVFASLDSNLGKRILKAHNIDRIKVDSIILCDANQVYSKSTAVIKIISMLGYFWKPFLVFLLIPTFVRDFFYDLIAKNRYKWFGVSDSCLVPTDELKSKFLD